MSFTVALFDRTPARSPFTAYAGVDFKVSKYSWRSFGGPYQAEINLSGGWDDLALALNWARYGVEIYNDYGQRVWWGYVQRVETKHAGLTMTADVTRMNNRVAVAYTTVPLGSSTTGKRATTAWLEDTISIGEYGIKELLDSHGGTNQTFAEASRARTLATKKYPAGIPQIDPQGGDETSATLYCAGWWSTLEWRYASVPAITALEYSTIGYLTASFGKTTGAQGFAESFVLSPASVPVKVIEIYVSKANAPSDNLTVTIRAAAVSGLPTGAALATFTIPSGSIGTSFAWVKAEIDTPVTLTAGAHYALTIERSGAASDANFYQVQLDAGSGYGNGVLSQRNGASWQLYPNAPAGDMPFRLYSNALVNTTQQIKSLITSYGQFLRRVYIDDNSGLTTESYRNGDTTALAEIEDLLEMGTSNNRRLLSHVYPDGSVRIYEEPAPTTAGYFLDVDGRFYQQAQALEPSVPIVGVWARLRNALPAGVNSSRLSGIDRFLIEQYEYDVTNDRINFLPLGEDDVFDWSVKRG